jgi:hypothetical protein
MKIKKLNSRGFSHDIVAVFFVLIFAIGGVGYMVASHADQVAPNWTSSNQWGSFVYGVGAGTTAPITHDQTSDLNLQFNALQTGYHTTDMAYYSYTLPAGTTATSLTMNLSYVNAGFDTGFVATGTPSNIVWKEATNTTQSNLSTTISLSGNPTVIYFGIEATGASGGVSGSFPADRNFTVNSYTLNGVTTASSPTASFTSSPASPVVGQSVQYVFNGTCSATPCTYVYSNQQADGSYSQFATAPTASYTYQYVGTKVVQLAVTDAQGHTDTTTKSFAVAAATTTPTPPPVASGGKLPWAPPTNNETYTTVNVTTAEEADPYILRLNAGTNYVVKLPSSDWLGALKIVGGRDVTIIGGHITVPHTATIDNDSDSSDEGLLVEQQTGTVHLEGLLFDCQASPVTMCDGLNVSAPAANIVVENDRMDNLWGTYSIPTSSTNPKSGEHADMIETWGGAKSLNIYNMTGSGDYQGLTIGLVYSSSSCPGGECTVNSYNIQNVNMVNLPPPSALKSESHGGGNLLLLTSFDTTCRTTGPMSLSNVYISNQSGGYVGNNSQVWPHVGQSGCPGVLSGSNESWPKLTNITGHVTLTAPPSGDFVPVGVAGTNYVSPGYN